MSKIIVLHLRDSPWFDGPGRTILESAARINPAKYDYLIGAFCKKDSQGNPFLNAALSQKLKVFRINEFHSLDLKIIFQITNLIRREKVDIIHTHEVRSDLFGLIAGKLMGVPVITTLHGWIQNGFKDKLFTKIDKFILRYFDQIISVSGKIKEDVVRTGVKPEKVSVLHNALVTEKFKRNSDDRRLRFEIGVDDETLLVGNIGRLSPEKRQEDFIRSASEVIRRHQKARFLIVGIGDAKPDLEDLSRSFGLQNKVLFLGYRSDMTKIYNGLDLVVQSSLTEGMPNVILEALAMEVPVIATNVGGTSEVVENGVTGTLISPYNYREMTKKILEFVQNPGGMKAMARNGAKKVKKDFDFQQRTLKLAGIYEDLMVRQIKK